MSFSSDVKSDLVNINPKNRHCEIAELAGILATSAIIDNKTYEINIESESDFVHETFDNYQRKLFNYDTKKLLHTAGFLNSEKFSYKINPLVLSSDCCKKAFIRMCFICCGSINDPLKSYHAEFVVSRNIVANILMSQINFFELTAKKVQRKGYYVVYLKESEQIADLLNLMGAYDCLLELENLRITKDIRNNINRKVNFETANISKTVNAAVKQLEDIQLISNTKGLSFLTPQLEDIARIRLENPDISLKDFIEKLPEPISKSGINHRLRKISQIADNIRNS